MAEPVYDEKSIKSLDWREHIRLRPGMYIGNVSGKGTSADEGLYVLIKEVADNCLDEFMMGYGKRIEITEGLESSDQVVGGMIGRLADGDTVNVIDN